MAAAELKGHFHSKEEKIYTIFHTMYIKNKTVRLIIFHHILCETKVYN